MKVDYDASAGDAALYMIFGGGNDGWTATQHVHSHEV